MCASPESLKELQRAFLGALIAPDTEDAVLELLNGDAACNRNRLLQYRASLARSWHKGLSTVYPVLCELVGEDFFTELAREYSCACLSHYGELTLSGHAMSDLLRAWPPCSPYPYLADIARLEWAIHRAYFSADARSLAPEDWLQYDPDVLRNSRFALHPSVQMVSSEWNIADIWYACQFAEPFESQAVARRAQHVIVARPRWIPVVLPALRSAIAALDALLRGGTLGEAIGVATACDGQFDLAANWRIWAENAIVVRPIVG